MRRFRWLALVAVVTLLGAACGRSSEETKDDVGTTETTAKDDGTSDLGLDDGAFGDLGVLCSAAPEGETLEATETGVTADSIQVSTFSDPGFTGRLGLNQEMFDTAEAFSAWCNEHGGINGREIDLTLRDAKLFEFQQRMIEACDEGAFAMVGGGAVFDDTAQTERLACELPAIPGYVVTAAASGSDLTVQPLPNPSNRLPVGDLKYLEEQFPESTAHVGIFTGQLETTVIVADRYKEGVETLGWDVVYEGTYNPVGEQSWRTFLEAMRNEGVRGLIWVGEPTNLAQLLVEAKSIDMTFDWVRTDANHYDAALIENAGDAADGTYVRSAFYPFADEELAAENRASAQYIELIDRYDEGGKIAYLGVQGLSAWLLFAKAAGECGADLTRDCLFEHANAIEEWTGGGLHAPQDLTGGGNAPVCYDLFKIEGGEFTLADIDANTGVYRCDEGTVIDLKGDYGTGAKCPNPNFADDPRPSNCA